MTAMIDKFLPTRLLALDPLSAMLPAPTRGSGDRAANPLAAYPLLEASLAEAERSGLVQAEKRRLVLSALRR